MSRAPGKRADGPQAGFVHRAALQPRARLVDRHTEPRRIIETQQKEDRRRSRPPGPHESRVLLVVEDDEAFARILRDLAQEMEFKCLVARPRPRRRFDLAWSSHAAAPSSWTSGCPTNRGCRFSIASSTTPDAAHPGPRRFRRADQAQTRFALGAVGYMLKPVERDELADVLRSSKPGSSQEMRRVLVVEDDPVQRAAVCKLLASRELRNSGRGNGGRMSRRAQTAARSTAWCSICPCPIVGLFAVGNVEPRGGVFVSAGHRLYRPRIVGRTRSSGSAVIRNRSSSRGPNRPSGCSTRSRCFCTKSSRICRPTSRR